MKAAHTTDTTVAKDSRFKVSAEFLPPQIGFWETSDWIYDREEALRIYRCAQADDRSKNAKLISAKRLPSGRWGKQTIAMNGASRDAATCTVVEAAAAADQPARVAGEKPGGDE